MIPVRAFLYYIGLSQDIDARGYNKANERVIANLPAYGFYTAEIPAIIAQSKLLVSY